MAQHVRGFEVAEIGDGAERLVDPVAIKPHRTAGFGGQQIRCQVGAVEAREKVLRILGEERGDPGVKLIASPD